MMAETSEARKRREAKEANGTSGRWSAALFFDGVQVTTPQPCADWDAATIFAPLVAGWLGGPVSVANAVIATRPREVEPQESLFAGVMP